MLFSDGHFLTLWKESTCSWELPMPSISLGQGLHSLEGLVLNTPGIPGLDQLSQAFDYLPHFPA